MNSIVSLKVPEDDGVPHHDVVLRGGPAHPGRGILLQPLEVPHEAPTGRSGHGGLRVIAQAYTAGGSAGRG